MNISYKTLNSQLTAKHRLNPHQQYLTVALAIGLIGLGFFMLLVFYPFIKFSQLNILFVVALTVTGISMFNEDVLETQAGCTQFIFIYVVTYMYHQRERLILQSAK